MLPDKIELEVVTPARLVLHETVQSVELPGANGYLGILPGHAALITELGIGHLSYQSGAETRYLTVIHGYAEVLPDRVIVLAEMSERAEEIDVSRAESARERAQSRLAKPGGAELDWRRAAASLERSLIRLQVASRGAPSPKHHA
jgi:F-type H+-transporting ATPase subunit epsilon